ncbi:MAG: DNA polymerase III subunit chi [Gammaproteobacteria bacterium]|nr:DNA polymerase III subunit chi [Gammaproteobacteria bacterium]
MTRVDFYILPDADPAQRPLLACRLAEKAYGQGLKVYVHTATEGEALHLDELLWTFRDGSFLPHAIAKGAIAKGTDPDFAESAKSGSVPVLVPVLVGHDHEPSTHTDVLINLGAEVPRFFGRFERVAELVDQRPEQLALSRERYRFYRERGYELNSHQLKR